MVRIMIRKSALLEIVNKSLFNSSEHPRGSNGRFVQKFSANTGNNGGKNKKDFRLGETIEKESIAVPNGRIPANSQITAQRKPSKHITLENDKRQYISNIKKVKTEKSDPGDFLLNIKNAMGADEKKNDKSCYFHGTANGKRFVLRISDHSSNSIFANKKDNEVSIVVALKENTFKKDPKKNVIEFLYKPENLTPEAKEDVKNGIIELIKNGNVTFSKADNVNKSKS